MSRRRQHPTSVPPDDIRHLIESLEPRLPLLYPELLGRGPHLTIRHQRDHRWSRQVLLEIRTPDGPDGRLLLAKLPFERDPRRPSTGEVRPSSERDSLALEYEALRAIWDKLGARSSDEMTAIRPIVFLPRLPAVVMEFLPGSRSLLALTRDAAWPVLGRRRSGAAIEAARSSGRLLRFLHSEVQPGAQETAPLDRSAYGSALDRRFDMLVGCGVAPEIVETRRARILPRIGEVTDEVVVTAVHGDMYPANVLRSASGQVCVVDATLHRKAPGVEDIAKLCVGLETMKPAVLGPLVDLRVLRTVQDAVLEGYYGQEAVPVRPLRCFAILALLRRWYEIRDVLGKTWGSLGPLATLVTRRVDSYMLERLDRWTDAL